MKYSYSNFIWDIYYYIKPYRMRFFLGFFIRLTSDLSQLYPAYALSQLTYLITLQKNEKLLSSLISILIFWGLAVIYRSISKEISKFLGFVVAERAALDIYKDCIEHMFRLDLAWHEIENSGNKFKRVTNGRDGMNQIIRRIFGVFIEVGVNTVGIVFIFASQDLPIAIALIFFIITFYFLGIFLLKKPSSFQERSSQKEEDLGGITFEALNNIRTIKSLSIDANVKTSIRDVIIALLSQIRQRIFWFRFQSGTLNLYYFLFEIAVVIFILSGIWSGHFQISLLILFVALYQRVGDSIWELMEVTQDVVISKIWVGRARDILRIKPEIEHPKKIAFQSDFPTNWKTIRIEHVKFTYETADVLRDITTTINRGEKIGIVGISGSGKSTFFKLLMDLYETYDGDIFIDDISLKTMKRQSYIDHVAVVLQDTELFNMSLKENIMITGVPGQKHDPNTLMSVIETAHLEDVIAQLPSGVDTLVGEKGIKLSGGQRQRVGIARALYRKPDLLLLDEATSHLDVHSEKQIQAALHEAFGQCTAIVIAHRLSTIKEMDRIIVMEQGEIKEQGPFADLLKQNGIFAKMWQEQTL
jgi:ATP-binding cassette, subfamily B, bacterial